MSGLWFIWGHSNVILILFRRVAHVVAICAHYFVRSIRWTVSEIIFPFVCLRPFVIVGRHGHDVWMRRWDVHVLVVMYFGGLYGVVGTVLTHHRHVAHHIWKIPVNYVDFGYLIYLQKIVDFCLQTASLSNFRRTCEDITLLFLWVCTNTNNFFNRMLITVRKTIARLMACSRTCEGMIDILQSALRPRVVNWLVRRSWEWTWRLVSSFARHVTSSLLDTGHVALTNKSFRLRFRSTLRRVF